MSNLKCPFCNGELYGCIEQPYCRNEKCEMCDEPMPRELLDLLYRTRKALEIAVNALKELKPQKAKGGGYWAVKSVDAIKLINTTIKQITALEQKE